MKALDWLKAREANVEFLGWVASQPDQSPEALVAACARADRLINIAVRCGYSAGELALAVRPTLLRALREHAPIALEAAVLREPAPMAAAAMLVEHAQRLRNLPDDISMATAASAAEDAVRDVFVANADSTADVATRAAWRASLMVAVASTNTSDMTTNFRPSAESAARARWEMVHMHTPRAAEAAWEATWALKQKLKPCAVASSTAQRRAAKQQGVKASEHARCAAELRAAMPDLAERWASALAAA